MGDLYLDTLSYRYPNTDRLVLDGFTARFSPGRTWWLTGPNGVGKTTLLEICAGLRLPTEGEVTFAGSPISPSQIAYLPSESPTFPELTIAEHEALVSELWGLKGKARDSFADRYFGLVTFLGIEERTERLAEFSKGMQDKVAIAMTIARPSGAVLLDEPFGALDTQSTALLQDIVRAEALTRVFVIVSHVPDTVAPLNPYQISLTRL